jgi:peptidoglycan/LPS O-acetylase OafA/YrhL
MFTKVRSMITVSESFEENKKVKRYRSVDVIKGIAMIMVILVHYGQNYQLPISKLFNYLQMGCPIFFVTSGFGMMCLVYNRYSGYMSKNNIKQYYFSRFIALAPGWYITFVLIFVINTLLLKSTGVMLPFGTNRGKTSIICNLLFVNGLLPFCNNNVMPGGWYIGTLSILYFLTPIIVVMLQIINKRRVFFAFSSLLGMSLWFILFFLFRERFDINGFGYCLFLVHYPEYLLGILLFYDFSSHIFTEAEIKKCRILSFFVLTTAIALFFSRLPFSNILSAWMTALFAYLALYYMISNESEKRKIWISIVLENFGKNSYYIFLLHTFFAWPFAKLMIKICDEKGISTNITFWILIPIILSFAFFAGAIFRTLIKVGEGFLAKTSLCGNRQ